MNILCYRYGSIVEPDIIDGFKELGNQVSEICLEIYNKNTTPLEGLTALKDELMRHSYDFVFSINFYPFIAEVCNIFQIRYLCLTVDAPVLELFSNSIRLPWNLQWRGWLHRFTDHEGNGRYQDHSGTEGRK